MSDSIMKQLGRGSFRFLRLPMLQWNNYTHFLIYLLSKLKLKAFLILKNDTKTHKAPNLYSQKYLFTLKQKSKNMLRAPTFGGWWSFYEGAL